MPRRATSHPQTLADVIAAWRAVEPQTADRLASHDPRGVRLYLEGMIAERTEHAAFYRRVNPARMKATEPAAKLTRAWLRAQQVLDGHA